MNLIRITFPSKSWKTDVARIIVKTELMTLFFASPDVICLRPSYESICGSDPPRWIFITQMCSHLCLWRRWKARVAWTLFGFSSPRCLWMESEVNVRSESVTFSSGFGFWVPLRNNPGRKIDSRSSAFYMDDMRQILGNKIVFFILNAFILIKFKKINK